MSIETAGTQIYRVADGQALKLLPTRFATDSTIGVTDFAGSWQMYAVQSAGFKKARVKVWDVKTGDELASFETPSCLDRPFVVTSPGGRYLAMYDHFGTSSIYIYELPGGKQVRTTKVNLPQASYTRCQALMFSDDGKELAGLFEIGGTSSRIRVWDVASGKRTVDHGFTPPLERTATNVRFYRVPLLWLPDGSGWFVFGQLMVDKVRGNVFWKMPPQDQAIPWPRRFVDADHLVTVMGKAPQRRFEIVTVPREEIEAARKK
jgi:WD40 repeat protein